MFSSRTPDDLTPSRVARLRAAAGESILDLTVSNPTMCDLVYPPGILDPLSDPEALGYGPDPRGLRSAREAVAAAYGARGCRVDPDRVVLTSSTSEAYAFLFKLLCDVTDAIAYPVPSYPLIEHLARLEGVAGRPYPLDPDTGWQPAYEVLAELEDDVRGVVVVHPNNPTGSYLEPAAGAALRRLATSRGWAIIVDEVFLDYPLDAVGNTMATMEGPLTFVLGGLSKSIGMPQVKLGWIVVGGGEEKVREALDRLDHVTDAFLSVSSPVQVALPRLLQRGIAVRHVIQARCRANLAVLREQARTLPVVEVLPVGGGWAAVIRFPAIIDEEEVVVRLLTEEGVSVQPGYFFDFPRDGYLVLSLLPAESVFASGVGRVLGLLAGLKA